MKINTNKNRKNLVVTLDIDVNKIMRKFVKERNDFIQHLLEGDVRIDDLNYNFINHSFSDYYINYQFTGWLARAGIKRPNHE